MGVLSGIEGHVQNAGSAISRVGEWSIDRTAEIVAKYGSNLAGGPIQAPGNYDWSGSYKASGPVPALKPGDLFQFVGVLEGTNNKGYQSGASGTIVDSIEVRWNQETAALIDHTVGFSANGALTPGTVSSPSPDTSVPLLSSSSGMLVKLDTPGGGSATELENVRSVTLRLARDNKKFYGSTTGKVPGRKKGNFSGEVSIDLYISDPSEVDALVNVMKQVQLFVTAAAKWTIESILFKAHSGIGANIENADLIAVTLTGAFSAYYDLGGTQTAGHILDSAGAYWWGSA